MTGRQLLAAWAERDSRYAADRRALSKDMADAVRASRTREVEALPADDRARAWAVLAQWQPPQVIR